MPEFKELEPKDDLDELDGEEAKEALSQFMEAHEQNKTAYAETKESAEEARERADEAEETLSEFRETLAEDAVEEFPSDFDTEDIIGFDIGKLYNTAKEAGSESPAGGEGGAAGGEEEQEDGMFSESNESQAGNFEENEVDEDRKQFTSELMDEAF